jgi:hypothetical protein
MFGQDQRVTHRDPSFSEEPLWRSAEQDREHDHPSD